MKHEESTLKSREERLAGQIARGLWHEDRDLYLRLSDGAGPPRRFGQFLRHPPIVVVWILAVVVVAAATVGVLLVGSHFLHQLNFSYPYNLG